MNEITQFAIGSEVSCIDGICGKLTRVVVDPVARTLTHLVVESGHRRGSGRLVPVDLVDASSGQIRLRCTTARFLTLENAEETQFLPASPGQWGYGQRQMLLWPYYGLGLGGSMGMGTGGVDMGRGGTAIPIGVVAGVENGIRLTLDKDQVRDLPPVDFDDQQQGVTR